MSSLSPPPVTMMTPPSNKPLSSSGTTPSCDNYLLDLQSHVFPYRSPRPLTPPSLPPAPAYLSCWWTRDSTDFWGHFLETTSPQFSEPLSSLCQRGNSKPTTALMTQWREQFKRKKKIVDPLFPLSNLIPPVQPGPPRPPTPYPLPTLQSTHLPNWPAEPTRFPLTDQTPYLPGNITKGTLLQLRGVGVRNARSTQTYSFLPASWTGDTHEETDFLPIGDREDKERQLLDCCADSLETRQVLVAKYLQTRVFRQE